MNVAKCLSTVATLTKKDGTTFDLPIKIGKVRTIDSNDGYCRILKTKAAIKGCLSQPIDSLIDVTSIEIGGETWQVYHPPTYGCDHCKWMWVLRLRRVWLPCEVPSEICQCLKDPNCDGGFYAEKKFDTFGSIRKMNLAERVVDGVRQNVWTYRYYSQSLLRICELEDLRRLLIKHSDGHDYRIASANFDGDCPYAEAVREKTKTEIKQVEDDG